MGRTKRTGGDVTVSVTRSGGREQAQLTFRNGVEGKITNDGRISFRIYQNRLFIYKAATIRGGYAISRCHQTKIQRREMLEWARGKEGTWPLLFDSTVGLCYIEPNPEPQMSIEINSDVPEKKRQKNAPKEEKAMREAEGRTQGRKGCKAPRINMAFTLENWDYLRTMSAIMGQTMTQYCNALIEKHRNENKEHFERAKEIRKEAKGE